MERQAVLEDVDEITKRFEVSIPAVVVTAEYDAALGRLAGQVKVKGFRPGKVPVKRIEQLHGSRAQAEVTQKLVSEALHELIQEHKLEVVGEPRIDLKEFSRGDALSFSAELSLFPRPEVSGYESFEVEAPKREVTDQMVASAVDEFLSSKATISAVSGRDVAQSGDVIDAELVVEVAGREPERPEPVKVALGEGQLPPVLEQAVVGMQVGETKRVPDKVPDDHRDEDLRGKEIEYKLELKGLSEKVRPELDDTFVAVNDDVPGSTAVEFRLELRKQLEAQAEAQSRSDVNGKILELIAERNKFSVPQALTDEELRNFLVQSGVVDPQTVDPRQLPVEAFRGKLGPIAEQRVKTSIILDRIAEQESLQASDGEVEEAMQRLADENQFPIDYVRKFYQEPSRLYGLKMDLTRDKVLGFLRERCQVTYTNPQPDESTPDAG